MSRPQALTPERHPISQIAAIAVDSSLCALEELKIHFDVVGSLERALG